MKFFITTALMSVIGTTAVADISQDVLGAECLSFFAFITEAELVKPEAEIFFNGLMIGIDLAQVNGLDFSVFFDTYSLTCQSDPMRTIDDVLEIVLRQ